MTEKGRDMKKAIAGYLAILLLLVMFTNPLTVLAVSYPPAPLYHQQVNGEKVLTVGQVVYMFHSGTADVKKNIRTKDVLTVYRIHSSCEVTEVGKIRVISYIGETYLKGEVIQGEIKQDDIAKKGAVSCLIISAGMCAHIK